MKSAIHINFLKGICYVLLCLPGWLLSQETNEKSQAETATVQLQSATAPLQPTVATQSPSTLPAGVPPGVQVDASGVPLDPALCDTSNMIGSQKKAKIAENEIDFGMFTRTVVEGVFPPLGDADTKFTYPADLSQYDGKKVVIVGYMLPYKHVDKMDDFMLMGQPLWACNFCDSSWIKTAVLVNQLPDDVYPFDAVNPVLVEGKLQLWAKNSPNSAHQEGFIYSIQDAVVKAHKL